LLPLQTSTGRWDGPHQYSSSNLQPKNVTGGGLPSFIYFLPLQKGRANEDETNEEKNTQSFKII